MKGVGSGALSGISGTLGNAIGGGLASELSPTFGKTVGDIFVAVLVALVEVL